MLELLTQISIHKSPIHESPILHLGGDNLTDKTNTFLVNSGIEYITSKKGVFLTVKIILLGHSQISNNDLVLIFSVHLGFSSFTFYYRF